MITKTHKHEERRIYNLNGEYGVRTPPPKARPSVAPGAGHGSTINGMAAGGLRAFLSGSCAFLKRGMELLLGLFTGSEKSERVDGEKFLKVSD